MVTPNTKSAPRLSEDQLLGFMDPEASGVGPAEVPDETPALPPIERRGIGGNFDRHPIVYSTSGYLSGFIDLHRNSGAPLEIDEMIDMMRRELSSAVFITATRFKDAQDLLAAYYDRHLAVPLKTGGTFPREEAGQLAEVFVNELTKAAAEGRFHIRNSDYLEKKGWDREKMVTKLLEFLRRSDYGLKQGRKVLDPTSNGSLKVLPDFVDRLYRHLFIDSDPTKVLKFVGGADGGGSPSNGQYHPEPPSEPPQDLGDSDSTGPIKIAL